MPIADSPSRAAARAAAEGAGAPGDAKPVDAPADAKPVTAAAVAMSSGGGGSKRWISIAVVAVVAIALIFVGLAKRPKGKVPSSVAVTAPVAPSAPVPPLPSAAETVPAPPPAPPAVAPPTPSADSRRADAERLVAANEWEQALVVLQKAEKEHPEDGAVAADLANLALEHKRWAEGAQAARVAGQRDPKWRGDERLVKNLIRSLGSDKGYERTEDVLHGFGPPAVPLLKKAAAHDKSPVVRERAAELLRERSNSRSSRGPFSRSPSPSHKSSSGSRSIFTR